MVWFVQKWGTNPQVNGHVISLVGGIPTPLKDMKVSWDHYSQYMEKCSKPPTSHVKLMLMRK